jgi:ZIP family zinc transporter
MIENLKSLSAPLLGLMAGLFTWGMTALGACFVLFVKSVNRKLLDTALGFAAGVMIAASFWSLLAPAIEMSENFGVAPVKPDTPLTYFASSCIPSVISS